jgi:hypothetical protein
MRKKINKNVFTKEEIRILKEFAQEKLYFEKCFLCDEKGKKFPRGNYSDWVKAMKGEK